MDRFNWKTENLELARQTKTSHAELVSASEVGEIKSTPLSNSLPRRENTYPLQGRGSSCANLGELQMRERGEYNSFAKQTETLSHRPLRGRKQKPPFVREVSRSDGGFTPAEQSKKAAFTLAEVLFHPADKSKRIAFTLAEVLITLGIIGVVAAIVMPSLITNINDRVNAEKIRSAKYKFTKATDHMKSLGLIGPYSSTDAFVDELQKYFKIAKRCDADHIRACWPTDTVKLDNGKEWEIAKTKTGKNLKMPKDDNNDYSSDNVAIITADGTPMILNYNKKCEALDPMKTYGWTTSNGKPETNATAGCVAAVFEINGHSRPNTFRKDVVAFNANGLGSACAIEVNGKCFGAPFSPTPMTKAECEAEKGSLGIQGCLFDNDYWAGAVKQCNGIQNMPTRADLGKIASLLYEGNPTVGADQNVFKLIYNGKAPEYGLPDLNSTSGFFVWSGEELGMDGNGAYTRNLYASNTYSATTFRYVSSTLGLCLGE